MVLQLTLFGNIEPHPPAVSAEGYAEIYAIIEAVGDNSGDWTEIDSFLMRGVSNENRRKNKKSPDE